MESASRPNRRAREHTFLSPLVCHPHSSANPDTIELGVEHPCCRNILHAHHARSPLVVPKPPRPANGTILVVARDVENGLRQDRPTRRSRQLCQTEEGRRGVERVELGCRQTHGFDREELSLDRKGTFRSFFSLLLEAPDRRRTSMTDLTLISLSTGTRRECGPEGSTSQGLIELSVLALDPAVTCRT